MHVKGFVARTKSETNLGVGMKFRIDSIDTLPSKTTMVVIAVWANPESKLITHWVHGWGAGLKAALAASNNAYDPAAAAKSNRAAGCELSARAMYKTVPAYYRRKAYQESLEDKWCY